MHVYESFITVYVQNEKKKEKDKLNFSDGLRVSIYNVCSLHNNKMSHQRFA